MRILKISLMSLTGIAILLLVVGFLLPSHWTVERSIVIEAPPEVIYPLVANLRKGWPEWSAFDNEDPDITYDYSGPDEGSGAQRTWKSKKMGDGTQKIIGGNVLTGIIYELEMKSNGFKMTGEISFDPTGNSTKVTWKDNGDVGANPIHRYFGVLMDRLMGPMFEKSLTILKQKAEANVTTTARL